MSQNAENLRKESFTVALISVTENVWIRKGEYQDFPSKNFCLTVLKLFVEESFYCCINFGYRKILDEKEEYQDFPSENFCLTVPKISVEESFTVAVKSGTEKIWIRGGEYQDFPSKFFCLTVPKIFAQESLLLHKFRVSQKFE